MTIFRVGDPPKRTWGDWFQYLPIRVLLGLGTVLPFKMRNALIGRLVAGPLGRIAGYRARVTRNLDHVWPDLPQKEKDQIAFETLDNAGRSFVENLFPAEFQKAHTNIELWGEGVEAVLQAKAEGRGIVFVSGHFGNHEALRAALYEHGLKVGGLYRPMRNPYLNERYEEAIQLCGRSGPLFPNAPDGTRAFRKALTEGEQLVLVIDIAILSGEEMPFLGKPAWTSTAAGAFAMRADALYVPYFAMRNADRNSFSVEIAAPIEHTDARSMTEAANRVLEDRISKDPGNWFWLHRRWKPYV